MNDKVLEEFEEYIIEGINQCKKEGIEKKDITRVIMSSLKKT